MTNTEKLSALLLEYKFIDVVLQDICQRIGDCMMSYDSKEAKEQYIGQQVRYLENILKSQGISVNYK